MFQLSFFFFFILQKFFPFSVIKYDVGEEKPMRGSAGLCIEAAKGELGTIEDTEVISSILFSTEYCICLYLRYMLCNYTIK